MKNGNTSSDELASRTVSRGFRAIGCVAAVTTLALVLNGDVLAQGTKAARNTRQTDGQSPSTLARLVVPITGTVETAAPTASTETPTTPSETPTTVTETPTLDALSTADVTGSFSIRRFAQTTDGGLAAVGTLTLSVTDPTSNAARTIITELAMPIARSGDGATSGAANTTSTAVNTQAQPISTSSSASPSDATQSCGTLSLVIEPLTLDLLGIPVQLNETTLEIVAMPETNGRFRKVLCEAGNLMDGTARTVDVVRKLNTLLETIG